MEKPIRTGHAMVAKKTKIRSIIGLAIILAGLICVCHFYYRGKNPRTQPNILLISLDACRADHLSCYGYPRLTSPFIDELASQGTFFKYAFVNTHGTPPSHSTMFSSLYQETHGLGLFAPGKVFFSSLSENVPLLQEILHQNGYITIGVAEAKSFENMRLNRGFVEFETSNKISEVDSVADKTIRLVKKYSKKGKPIYLFFHTFEIHSPYTPPSGYKTIFGKFNSDFNPTSSNLKKLTDNASKLSESDIEFIKAMYDCEIRYTNDVLRNLFGELRRLDFFHNYIAIITADHGEEFGDHGGLLHRALLYDELIRVPFIVIGNSVNKGFIDERLVSSIDIMPTILAYADIKSDVHMEGRNLLSPSRISNDQKQMVFSQYGNLLYSVRTHKWKLIENVLLNSVELYNLEDDPNELVNLAGKYPDLLDFYRDNLATWRSSRMRLEKLKEESIPYSKEGLERLRTLGYVE